MRPNELPSVWVSRRGTNRLGGDQLRTVVWVRGEHDIATRVHLSVTIAQAARLDDADMVVDLSGVTFMDASTIGTIIGARNRLRRCSRSLSVRAPSPRARRLLDLCGLMELIDEPSAPAPPPAVTALGSWVDVPALERGPTADRSPLTREAPFQEPVCVMARCVEPSRSVEHPRAPS